MPWAHVCECEHTSFMRLCPAPDSVAEALVTESPLLTHLVKGFLGSAQALGLQCAFSPLKMTRDCKFSNVKILFCSSLALLGSPCHSVASVYATLQYPYLHFHLISHVPPFLALGPLICPWLSFFSGFVSISRHFPWLLGGPSLYSTYNFHLFPDLFSFPPKYLL